MIKMINIEKSRTMGAKDKTARKKRSLKELIANAFRDKGSNKTGDEKEDGHNFMGHDAWVEGRKKLESEGKLTQPEKPTKGKMDALRRANKRRRY